MKIKTILTPVACALLMSFSLPMPLTLTIIKT